jgi:hypothetical protein
VVPLQIKICQPGNFVPSSCCNSAAGKLDGMMLKEMLLLVKQSAEIGAGTALAADVCQYEKLTKSEAYRSYGRASVDRWLKEGLLKPDVASEKKSPKCIDRKKLEAIAANSNRITYLPVANR